MSVGTNYLLGTVDKAAIYVPSIEGIKEWKTTASLLNASTEDFMSMITSMGETMIRTSAKASLEMAKLGLAGLATGQALEDASAKAVEAMKAYKRVEVQYNPKTLSISSVGGKTRTYSAGLGIEAENGINQVNNDISSTLSCELVFSNVNISDAFMTEDLMNFNIESALGEVSNVAKRMMGKSPSVQPQVDGILSTLTNEYTRYIIFSWGGMVFRGELTRVDANYKMFNKNGDPILATVSISIRQGFNKNAQSSETVWRDRFERTFKKKD